MNLLSLSHIAASFSADIIGLLLSLSLPDRAELHAGAFVNIDSMNN